MKIVAAPDSFKGSISAQTAARAMANGIQEVMPSAQVVELPLADGGEGTMVNLVAATGGHIVSKRVSGPLGQPVQAGYGVLGDGKTCVIEIAEASGLPLLKPSMRDPYRASTEGTGELIRHALDAGLRKFIIGLGGSATNDGGTGMLRALGMEFFDAKGEPLQPGGGDLGRLHRIDAAALDGRLTECRFLIASDVDNPLVGKNGASAVFGPQKGASAQMVKELDHNLAHYADVVERTVRIALHDLPGAGAAGGAGGAFLAFFPSEMRRGIDVILEAAGFFGQLENCDLVLTGEGKSDLQTLAGKAPFGVAQAAARLDKPVLLISGMVSRDSRQALGAHFTEVHSVVGGDITRQQSFEQAEKYLQMKTEQVFRSYLKLNEQGV